MANILILEDDLELSFQWQEILRKYGHSVKCQENADISLKQLSDSEIDLVIVDMFFRQSGELKLQGLEFLNVIDQIPDNQMPQILAVSGQNIDGSILNVAKVFNVDATLLKPISPKLLVETVSQLLKQKNAALDS